MKVAEFDYDLPPGRIAQKPAEPRDSARLLHLDRASDTISHHTFRDLAELLQPEDALLLNDTRALRARLMARKARTGGQVEILLLKRLDESRWRALVGGRKIRRGTRLLVGDDACVVLEELERAERVIAFKRPVEQILERVGEVPLPPYIQAELADSERYQTVYGSSDGSAAAPTAGLHFTRELLAQLERKGLKLARCTLHIGLDTFQPVLAERVDDHKIHSEQARLDDCNAAILNRAKKAGGRLIAVGTTSARTLETAAILAAGGDPGAPAPAGSAKPSDPVSAFEASTSLFIKPGYQWRAVDAMITNFHLPRSTLLMMLSAFAGRERMLAAYELAKQLDYRFYSFGDAMLIT